MDSWWHTPGVTDLEELMKGAQRNADRLGRPQAVHSHPQGAACAPDLPLATSCRAVVPSERPSPSSVRPVLRVPM